MQRLNILDHLSQNLLTVTDFDQRDDFTNNIVLNMKAKLYSYFMHENSTNKNQICFN